MTNEEVRASKEYLDAFANYIKTEDDKECLFAGTGFSESDGREEEE